MSQGNSSGDRSRGEKLSVQMQRWDELNRPSDARSYVAQVQDLEQTIETLRATILSDEARFDTIEKRISGQRDAIIAAGLDSAKFLDERDAARKERDTLLRERQEMANQVLTAQKDYIEAGKRCCRKCGQSAEEFVAMCAALLVARDNASKAQALEEAAADLVPGVPSPIGPLHAAGMMSCVEYLRKKAAELYPRRRQHGARTTSGEGMREGGDAGQA